MGHKIGPEHGGDGSQKGRVLIPRRNVLKHVGEQGIRQLTDQAHFWEFLVDLRKQSVLDNHVDPTSDHGLLCPSEGLRQDERDIRVGGVHGHIVVHVVWENTTAMANSWWI